MTTRAWFLQGNPQRYDVDGALKVLDRIWWRVPQHTSDIAVGDIAVLWRSGPDAGIVGIGTVSSAPQIPPSHANDEQFSLSEDEAGAGTTSALVHVRASSFIPKAQVQALPGFGDHLIIKAPMGTVFAIGSEQWEQLKVLLPPPPPTLTVAGTPLPPPFAWPQRAKGVLPMPGGYDDYLHSVRHVCTLLEAERPAPDHLADLVQRTLGITATSARIRASFLRKVGIVEVREGICRTGRWAEKWLSSSDDRVVTALLHSRCQFIGELLEAACEPRTPEDLLRVANDGYSMGWDTQAQVNNRRGWLQSAGMLAAGDDGRLQTTAAGEALLAELELWSPPAAVAERAAGKPAPAPTTTETSTLFDVDLLADRLATSAIKSSEPQLFEQAARDAFAFLGFRSEWLGAPGKTDVLLDAALGQTDTYRVIVDCKTSASGAVGDAQVDWDTLKEHKAKHDADYVVLLGPNPSGGRLFHRAEDHGVTVVSVDQLIGLCRQHAKTPLTLDDYRSMLGMGGAVDTQVLDERATETARLVALAATCLATIRERSVTFGRLTARDLLLVLSDDAVVEGTSKEELQSLLTTLASPLVGALDGEPVDGYRLTSSLRTASQRIRLVADQVAHHESSHASEETTPSTDGTG